MQLAQYGIMNIHVYLSVKMAAWEWMDDAVVPTILSFTSASSGHCLTRGVMGNRDQHDGQ